MEFHDAKYLYLQDVPEEEIPPMGNVLAIHDKRNRLLWSRMHYGVSFSGDTTQKKYKGKNLMNYNTYNADDGRVMYMPNLVLPAGTYTISFDLESFDLGTNTSMSVYMSLYNSGGTNVTGDNNILTINSSTSLSRYFFTFTASDEVHGNSSQIRLTSVAYSANGRCKLSNIQIEDGSLATSYEPYVGGIPAPNPYYPQAINVVTGVQTISVSDGGGNTQTFTIDLGSTEFCKLSYEMGSYEDIIYENMGDWYILRSIGKVDLADQTWGEASSPLKSTTTIPDIKYVLSSSQVGIGLAEKYIMRRASGMATAENYIAIDTDAVRVNTGDASITPTGLFYYVLEDAVLTKITDPTLLGQLNAVWSWLNRYGYNFTVTGNLPIVVFRSEL